MNTRVANTTPSGMSKSSLQIYDAIMHKNTSSQQMVKRASARDSLENKRVNLKSIEWLTELTKKYENSDEAHEVFMDNYRKIFEGIGEETSKMALESALLANATARGATVPAGTAAVPAISADQTPASSMRSKTASMMTYSSASGGPVAAITAGAAAGTGTAAAGALENTTSSTSHYGPIAEDLIDTASSKKHGKEGKPAFDHNISIHMQRIRKIKGADVVEHAADEEDVYRKLRRLLRKFPFERTAEENKEIYRLISQNNDFTSVFASNVRDTENFLEKLCGYAILVVVNKEIPIMGNLGVYVVLSGGARPLSVPHLNAPSTHLGDQTPEPEEPITLGVGSCFGTITELTGRDIRTRMLRVVSMEDSSEFMMISIESFNKLTQKFHDEERDEKLRAIQSCSSYSSRPRHLIQQLMAVFEWREFAPNTILTSEGYKCPFIGFINRGECHVLRKVDVPHLNKQTGKKEKKMRQVVVGKMKAKESFGEMSTILKEPMSCTIVTETHCRIGIIPSDKLSKLESLTLRLLSQTSVRNFADMSEQEIYQKFIKQEKKKEWTCYKNAAIQNVIEKYEITHGKGKYKSIPP